MSQFHALRKWVRRSRANCSQFFGCRRLRGCGLALALALALAIACAPPANELELLLGLLEQDHRSHAIEDLQLRFGTAESRGALTSGWSDDRYDSHRKKPYVASIGASSTVTFTLSLRRPLQARFSCRPMHREGAIPRAIQVALNGEIAGRVEIIGKEIAEYEVSLPSTQQTIGDNYLTFAYEYGDLAGQPPAPLAWYHLQVRGHGAAPEVEPDKDTLFLPFGSQADHFVTIPEGAELQIAEIAGKGRGEGRLVVAVEADHKPPAELARLTLSNSRSRVDLSSFAGDAIILSLRAEADSTFATGAGLTINSPAIWSPPAPRLPALVDRSTWQIDDRPPPIFIYLIDTLRADHLGCYGYPKPVSPQIDRFAQQSVVFENAMGQSSWTRASVASLMTGLLPQTHGAYGRLDALSQETILLSEILQQANYSTTAIITNPNVQSEFGFDQGFDRFVVLRHDASSDRVHQAFLDVFEAAPPRDQQPVFVYLHTSDPHSPYAPPEEFRQRFAPETSEFMRNIARMSTAEKWNSEHVDELVELYDAEIAHNDQQFGRFLDVLRDHDLFDRALIVLLSDHGEEFLDHGSWRHGQNLHSETVRIPLVIKFPGQTEGHRTSGITQQIDLLPTVLDLLQIDPPDGLQGRSLIAATNQPVRGYSHLHLDGPEEISLIDGDWKLIVTTDSRGRVSRQLYHWRDDPEERHNLATTEPIRVAALDAVLRMNMTTEDGRVADEVAIDPELEKSLKALGYLQ